MKLFKNLLLAVSMLFLVGCGGGSSGDNSNTIVDEPPSNLNLSKATLVYSQSPRINDELKLSIQENISASSSDYVWKVVTSPSSSNLQLAVSNDTKSVLLSPSVAGKYEISATPSGGETISTQFSIEKAYAFDKTKLDRYDSTQELSTQSGIVSNQAWIYSQTLNQAALESIVSNYQGFTIIDFDEIRGLLIEYDETLVQSQTNLTTIRALTGIDSVDARVFEGKDTVKEPLKIADDGSAFDDAGDNWHLEHIGIPQAWDISTGSDNFFIGIADSVDTFFTDHEDLKGRFKEASRKILPNDKYSWHGTGVAGSIGAISNNKKGMSGINWSNQLVAGKGGYEGLKNIVSRKDIDIPLINNSYSMVTLPEDGPDEFEPDNPLKAEIQNAKTHLLTTDYRKLSNTYSNKLFIFAAGNGVGNGKGFKGFYGIDGRYGNPALHYIKNKQGELVLSKKSNVLFVAAMLRDNRLAYYSNYGRSVDIAAPTSYKSTKYDFSFLPIINFDQYYEDDEYGVNETKGGFAGTSAASPVVTGVASLILSVDPTFTAAEVKNILINSATEFVTERYKHPGNEDEGFSEPGPVGSGINIESLSHPIPILNAAAALAMAKQIKKERDEAGAAGLLSPITPLTETEIGELPSTGNIPSISFKEETGFDGDIDQDLFLVQGVSSIQVTDVQRDFGLSVICEDGIQKPFSLNSADYSTGTIIDTFYENGQVIESCSSRYQSVLPTTVSNANITNILEDWESEANLISSDCPIQNNVTAPTPPINTACTSIVLRNYLITDSTGKEHKVSIKLTTTLDN